MIKNIITGAIDYISDVVTDENNLPYKTVHFLDLSPSIQDNHVDEFLDDVLENEISLGIITKEQADGYKMKSDNSFQTVIVFYDYKSLDEFKVKDFVHVIFNDYDMPLAEDSCFYQSVLKVGLYLTKDYKDSNYKFSEYINTEVEEYNI